MELRPKTTCQAVGRWPGILQGLGIAAEHLKNKHGPCPACGGKDRFRFDDKEGRGTWICSHCGSGDGIDLLRAVYGWGFKEAASKVDSIVGTVLPGTVVTPQSEESKVAALRAVWAGSRVVVKGDPVWLYLNRRLGIEAVPSALRFHPSLRHTDGGNHPAMIALMRYPDGSAASIHRTYLTENGEKADVSEAKKFMAGKPLKTAAVPLAPRGDTLGIAEGIETALAAARRFRTPVWAATNAVLLEEWIPPVGVRKVLVAGDNDKSCTGQAAAFALARRLVRDGYEVKVQIPETEGRDWADASL